MALSDSHRFGVLGQGSILTVTAYPNRTSPVLRGKWLLDNVLGSPPPPPPDDVPAHPYAVAMEVANLAQNAEVTIYPWKDSQEHIDEVVEHARRFLKGHVGATKE